METVSIYDEVEKYYHPVSWFFKRIGNEFVIRGSNYVYDVIKVLKKNNPIVSSTSIND